MTLPDLIPVANHLWQSTLFAALAGLLTLALRKNPARVRHGVWLVASIKFILPFSLLIALGGQFRWSAKPEISRPGVAILMDKVSQPFTGSEPLLAEPSLPSAPTGQPIANALPVILAGVWLCGFLGIAGSWWIRWLRIRAAVRASLPVDVGPSIRAVSAPMNMEPGVFGVVRPTLVLPVGILNRLTPTQLKAVIAHELYHIRHRDNLVAAFQMLVETVFWFHPLVWWIGKRMVAEREQACDEEVLRDLGEPRAYADAILNICRSYVESPLVCVSGVSGANLKKRIEDIMANHIAVKLNAGRRLLLAGAGALAVIVPVAIGLLNAPPIRAQAQPAKAIAFEAASVKLLVAPDRGTLRPPMALPAGGRFVSKFWLSFVISFAYKLPFNDNPRLAGVPAWVRSTAYDIEAIGAIPAGLSVQAREDRVRSMVRTLLADRFKMAIHVETKTMPVYELTVAKGGPKLEKADIAEKDCPEVSEMAAGPSVATSDLSCHVFAGSQGRGLHARAADMSDLVSFVANWTGRPILDKTGVKGVYKIETKGWLPMMSQPPAPGTKAEDGSDMADVPTLFQVFERLGLKMEARNDKADVYVVDHIEKPSEN